MLALGHISWHILVCLLNTGWRQLTVYQTWLAFYLGPDPIYSSSLRGCLLVGALDHNKGRKAFTNSQDVVIALKNRVTWFHRYEAIIEKVFARLWSERPEEDSISLFLWSFWLQQRNDGVVALWFTPSHESSIFCHICEFGPPRPLWRARFNLLVDRLINFGSNRNNAEDSTLLRQHLMA